MKRIHSLITIIMVVLLMLIPSNFAFATGGMRELTDREKAAFIVRDEWTAWVKAFTASLSELDMNATSRIYDNMDYYDMQYRFTEKYKKVPEYLDEDGKPTQKLKDLIKKKRREIHGVKTYDFLEFTARVDGSEIWYIYPGASSNIDVGISFDGMSFTKWESGVSNKQTLQKGESVWIKNTKNTLSDSSNQFKFGMSGEFDASGNVNSMINFADVSAYCFFNMFNGCDSLKTAPELPSTTLAPWCYHSMFANCEGLTTAMVNLPAKNVDEKSYAYMFNGCTNLTQAPSISATSVGTSGCEAMFYACSNLVTAPELRATTLGGSAYDSMFASCTNLLNAPSILPAENIPAYCYQGMFQSCANLTKAPEICATTLTPGACYGMFRYCANLNDIKLHYTGPIIPTYFTEWVNGVANEGIINYDGTYTGADDEFGPSRLPKNATNKWTVLRSDTTFLTLKALNSGTNVKYVVNGTVTTDKIYYSKNNGAWILWNPNTNVSLNANDTLQVWNKRSTLSTSATDYVQFVTSNNVEATGSVNSMVNFAGVTDYCFNGLFKDTKITIAPELSSTTLALYCYHEMFSGCDKLTKTPDLPATTLAAHCYSSMFEGCDILTDACVLEATDLAVGCYEFMFKDCIYLEKAPQILATTIGAGSLANMFNGCQRLNYIDMAYIGSFDSINFNNWVLNVASSGTILYDGPDTTIGPSAIPFGWTVQSTLKFTALENGSRVKYVLSGGLTRDNIFYKKNDGEWTAWSADTFIDLNTTDVLKVWNKDNTLSESTTQYFKFVMEGSIEASSDVGSLLNYETLKPYCFYKLFEGCTALKKAPRLGKTTLAIACYQYMFAGCSSLEKAPDLPATTLANYCYYHMFNGCSNLNYIYLDYAGQITTTNFSGWVDGVADTGEIFYMGTTNTFGPSGLPKNDDHKWIVTKPLTFTAKASSGVSYAVTGSVNTSQIYYKKGTGAWTRWTPGTNVSLGTNESLYVWNRNNTLGYSDATTDYNLNFSMTGNIEASGNVNSMINFDVLTPYCFNNLFANCTALRKAPELPSTTLAEYCYKGMFSGCSNLTKAPELLATTLVDGCYESMFANCSTLNEIKLSYDGLLDGTTYFTNWVSGVSNTGNIYYEGEETVYGPSAIPKDTTNKWNIISAPLTLTALENNSKVYYKLYGGLGANQIYYITEDGTKTKWNNGETNAITLNAGESIQVTNDANTLSTSTSVYFYFVMPEGKFAAKGDITSMVNNAALSECCFANMFKGCANLATVSELKLSSNTLKPHCYWSMFENCTSITEAPKLPATTLATSCYKGMFKGCSNLKIAPDLPATKLESYCYYEMFRGCTQLKTAPYLPATTLATECYWSMFNGCTNLNRISLGYTGNFVISYTSYTEFTAWVDGVSNTGTIIYDGNSTTYHFSALPKNDTYRWKVVKSLKLTGSTDGSTVKYKLNGGLVKDNIYYKKNSGSWTKWDLASGSSNTSETITLNSGDTLIIRNNDKTLSESSTKYFNFEMTGEIEASGCIDSLIGFGEINNYSFYKLFNGCTALKTAPEMSLSTTLKPHCYDSMFAGCTGLTTAPALTATTLAQDCYNSIFANCSNLNSINLKYYTGDIDSTYFDNWVEGVSNSGTITYLGSTATYGPSAIPKNDSNKWTVKSALTLTALEDNSKVYYTLNGGLTVNSIYYVKEDGVKTKWSDGESNAITLNAGEKLMVLNDANTLSSTTSMHFRFVMPDGKFTASGDVNSMINYSSLSNACFANMFRGCANLATVSELRLPDEIADSCYYGMFGFCTSITKAPKLPATSMAQYCYYGMFDNCSNLLEAPELPAMTLADFCYHDMFRVCGNLVEAPQLPATNLATSCYGAMFYNCGNLTTVQEDLPATTLIQRCYESMFQNCIKLEVAPKLPATTLVANCYYQMFSGCERLNRIQIGYTGAFTNSNNEFINWVSGVSNTGTFIYDGPETNYTYGPHAIPKNNSHKWTVVQSGVPFTFTARETGDTKVELRFNGGLSTSDRDIYYKKNDGEWTQYTSSITLTQNDTVSFWNQTNSWSESADKYITIYTDKGLDSSGNVMSLVNYGDISDYCFYKLFNYTTASKLYSAPELPATTLAPHCYDQMFSGCSNLTVAPNLPATTLADSCYCQMFYQCSNLVKAPYLPATTLAPNCYKVMFMDCTRLSNISLNYDGPFNVNKDEFFNWVSGVSDSGTFYYTGYDLDNYGYNTIPKLSSKKWNVIEPLAFTATQDNSVIYYTLNGSLARNNIYVWTPDGKEINWESGEANKITLNNGEKIYVMNRDTQLSTSLTDYFNFVMPSGKFEASGNIEAMVNNAALSSYCYNSLFSGCTNLTLAPQLLRKSLADYCYYNMFNGCTSLIESPKISATTLASKCFARMFYGCSNLNKITLKSYLGNFNSTYFEDWVNGVASSGTFHYNGDTTNYAYGVSAIPKDSSNKWTITQDRLIFTASQNSSTIKFTLTSLTRNNIKYSKNGGAWTSWSANSPVTLNTGETLMVKNNDSQLSTSQSNYLTFESTGQIKVEGQLSPLLNYNDVPYDHCFYKLFYNNSALTSAESLELFDTTAEYCYEYMFSRSGITETPKFDGIKIFERYGCAYMFEDCDSLTTAHDFTNAKSMFDYSCSYMFRDCGALTQAPVLPAQIIRSYCYYYMFAKCGNLQYAPDLVARKLNYKCYERMFDTCGNLISIKLYYTGNIDDQYFKNWVNGVTSSGTFYYNGPTETKGVNAIPTYFNKTSFTP